MRTVGVEEELLLVDPRNGQARSVASEVLRIADAQGWVQGYCGPEPAVPGGSLGPEFQNQQVETDTPPEQDMNRLELDLRSWREKTRTAALEMGALILASGTAPLPVRPELFEHPRYREMSERFGLTADEQLTCGCHVHVGVASDDEAIGVLDRIRVWLPTLLALSVNSPFWQGADTSYESYRSQVVTRWPTNGPTEIFGSVAAYRDQVSTLVGTAGAMDPGMIYFDARASARYPTVEVRVADVCLDVRDAVLVAALSRALVETAARAWLEGTPAPQAPVALLRLATWQAGRYGLGGDLLDPVTHSPRPARVVIEDLLAFVGPALQACGDQDRVQQRLAELQAGGTGADRQRAALAKHGRLDRAVVELARMTCPPLS